MGLIVALLVIWLILSILGFVVKGLLWLAIIGLVLLVATAVWGWIRTQGLTRTSTNGRGPAPSGAGPQPFCCLKSWMG